MNNNKNIEFQDNSAAGSSSYISVIVDTEAALKSYRDSIFSFQWLKNDGNIKTLEELPEDEQPKRRAVEEALENNQAIQKPILGIGIQDNLEIGSGRAEFLTLAAQGYKTIAVHIPKSNEKEFKKFLVE